MNMRIYHRCNDAKPAFKWKPKRPRATDFSEGMSPLMEGRVIISSSVALVCPSHSRLLISFRVVVFVLFRYCLNPYEGHGKWFVPMSYPGLCRILRKSFLFEIPASSASLSSSSDDPSTGGGGLTTSIARTARLSILSTARSLLFTRATCACSCKSLRQQSCRVGSEARSASSSAMRS